MSEMNFVTVGDCTRIAYRFDGDATKPVLVLSNSIGTTLHMRDGQVDELSKYFRVLRYDFRGGTRVQTILKIARLVPLSRRRFRAGSGSAILRT
jgi:pimeloyl-ACP methyl ester carboxylesterase